MKINAVKFTAEDLILHGFMKEAFRFQNVVD